MTPPAPPPPPPVTEVLVLAVASVPDDSHATNFLVSQPVTCDGGECPAITLNMFGIVDYPRESQQLSPAGFAFA